MFVLRMGTSSKGTRYTRTKGRFLGGADKGEVQLTDQEGRSAVQDVVEDDGGGTVVGGGEDRRDVDGCGHEHRHGHVHGQCGCDDATLTGGG